MTPGARRIAALVLGLVAAAAWTVTAQVSFDRGLQPVRPLYDGGAHLPPYRWVDPPAAFEKDNTAPEPGTKTFPLKGPRSPSETASTADSQAVVVFAEGGFEVPAGATAVEVTITPLDPEPIAPAPKGTALDGNAYRFDAVYLPSREPVRFSTPCPEVTSCATVILRWPMSGTKLLRAAYGTWTEIAGVNRLPEPSSQIYGNVDTLGTFAAAGAPAAPAAGKGNLANTIALVLGVVTVVGAVVVSRVLPARRKARAKRAAAVAKAKRKAARRRRS